MQAAFRTGSCGSHKPICCIQNGGHFPHLEAVNGVPIAVKEEAVASRKENRLWRFGWN